MVLGLSFGEVALIIVVGAVAFGPKDLPIIARTAGRVTGQAVGYISALRSRAQTFAEKTQLDELHKELQKTMSQLEAIRYEIRSGANILVPGSMTNRLATRVAEAATGGRSTMAAGGATSPGSVSIPDEGGRQSGYALVDTATVTASASASTSSSSLPQLAPSLVRRLGCPEHQMSEPLQSRALDGTRAARERLESGQSLEELGLGPSLAQDPLDRRKGVPDGRTERVGGIETLPISAVGAGLIPKRADGGTSGADILSDAIIERHISLQARDFIKNMAQPPS